MPSAHFTHLSDRCAALIKKYADPVIQAEEDALEKKEPIPVADIDNILALRLIAHAELEFYFEQVALDFVNDQRKKMDHGQTAEQSALIFLYMQKRRVYPTWTDTKGLDDDGVKSAELSDFKNLLTAAFGFASDAITKNNGIKESSIILLAALAGKFPSQISETLIRELDKYGSDRGEVAHKSWSFSKKANIESATIEKNRINGMLKLIKEEFED